MLVSQSDGLVQCWCLSEEIQYSSTTSGLFDDPWSAFFHEKGLHDGEVTTVSCAVNGWRNFINLQLI